MTGIVFFTLSWGGGREGGVYFDFEKRSEYVSWNVKYI